MPGGLEVEDRRAEGVVERLGERDELDALPPALAEAAVALALTSPLFKPNTLAK